MRYKTVILGSGYFSLGYASTHEDTLIIEDTQLADPHFFGTLDGFDMNIKMPSSKGARGLYDLLFAEGSAKEGRLAVNELEPALCRFIGGKKPNILFGSFCTEIKELDGGFELTVCNNEGLVSVFCEKLIDTRIPYGDRFNLLIAVKDGKEPKIDGVKPAFYDDQRIVELKLEGNDINSAKSRVLELYSESLREAGARIICTSYRMFGAPRLDGYADGGRILRVDERAFGDICEAFEKGETWE